MFEIFLKHINYMASPTSPHLGFGFLCFRSKADQKSLCHALKKKNKIQSPVCVQWGCSRYVILQKLRKHYQKDSVSK